MINTNETEAGDKVHLRCGSVLVVTGSPGALEMAGFFVEEWNPHDIIRIEKAPKPVVRECYISIWNGRLYLCNTEPSIYERDEAYKITITVDEAKIERVK